MTQSKDQSLLKLVHYFVSKHNYSFVQVQDIKDEVWLANPSHPVFPVIRLTHTPVNATFFDKDRIEIIHKAIAAAHNIEAKLLDIHTKVESQEDYDEDFVQVSLNEQSYIPEFLSKTFSDIKMAFSTHPQDPQIAPKQQIKGKQKASQFFGMIPPVTMTFLMMTVAVFVLLRLLALQFDDQIAVSILLGSYYKVFVVANHEYWRFLTAGFVHIDFFHILINSIALINLGIITERIFGHVKFGVILIVSIVFGSWFVFVAQGNMVLVGSSGGLYGLMGALFVYTFESGMIKQRAIRSQFTRILLINLMISLLPGVSLLGHLGGFVAGVLLAIIFSTTKKWSAIRHHSKLALVTLTIAMVGLSWLDNNVYPPYLITDQRVINYAREINFDWYADGLETSLRTFYGGN